MKVIRDEFILEGLDCPNCASKIERKVCNINGMKSANLNFVSKKLIIETDEGYDKSSIITEIKSIVKEIEPDVNIVSKSNIKIKGDSKNESDGRKLKLIQLIIGGILFSTAMILKFQYYIEFILYLISYIIVGGEVILKAFNNIKKGSIFDENFLMLIATLGAFSIKQYPEGVAVMLFYQVGEFFQDLAVDKSRRSISSLMDIRPDFANVKSGNEIMRISPDDVKIGDIIIVKPGEKIPLDGKIIEGKSMVDTSNLTGESVPRKVEVNDDVFGGFINKNGLLTIEVSKEFGESTISKILQLVENASSKKAPTENFITKFARYYTPVVVFAALAVVFLAPIFIKNITFSQSVYKALIFLVVSCPCALVISIPLSFFGGIGAASKNGILVKGGNYLEALNKVDTIVFDKTGTLTKGVFKVVDVSTVQGIKKEELIEYAAMAETYSNHPIAISIRKAYGKDIDESKIEDYEEISGLGISATVYGKNVLAGNTKLMDKEKIEYAHINYQGTIIHLSVDKKYAGYIIIDDEVKDDSKLAIKELKDIGVKKIVMLTGDNELASKKVAQELELDKVYFELLPHQKVEKLEALYDQKSRDGKLIFVGDGVNDAPVLARADIGIAMGGVGSDAAIEAADIVIMDDKTSKISAAMKIAKRTKNIVWQNIIFALGVKLCIMILGLIGFATMWEAVFGDVGVALIAVLNATRILYMKN
ncbi:heavy metal translocating P-type ATPase [Clostridium sp. JN-1]|uniref:heavy metal translocating P-type ATPase n=1 Tax=Clostridium sp. JN-1 TaxID=2483110 RepID=UPI00325A532B